MRAPATGRRGDITVLGGERMGVHVQGQGPAVVLLHGIPGSGGSWHAVAEGLAGTHRVIVPDLLGFGSSSRPADRSRLWADSQADALGEALDTLGVTLTAVVGHDYGGPVALHLLRQRPGLVSHLALAATNAFPDTPIPMPISMVTWPVVGRALGRLLFSGPGMAAMLSQGASTPGLRLDRGVYLGNRAQQASVRWIFSTSLRYLEHRYAPLAALLPAIDVPTLVVWGGHDPFFTVEQGQRTAAAIKGARFELLQGTGHFLPEERPGEFAELVRDLVAAPVIARAG